MKATVRDPQALRSIRPDDLRQYLSSRGWTTDPHQNGLAAIYTLQLDGTDFELLVPRSSDLRDFPQRMSEVLRTLEIVEKRDQIQILSDLTSARAEAPPVESTGSSSRTTCFTNMNRYQLRKARLIAATLLMAACASETDLFLLPVLAAGMNEDQWRGVAFQAGQSIPDLPCRAAVVAMLEQLNVA